MEKSIKEKKLRAQVGIVSPAPSRPSQCGAGEGGGSASCLPPLLPLRGPPRPSGCLGIITTPRGGREKKMQKEGGAETNTKQETEGKMQKKRERIKPLICLDFPLHRVISLEVTEIKWNV